MRNITNLNSANDLMPTHLFLITITLTLSDVNI